MTRHPNPYAGDRFPPEIISHAIWLYFRFPLSLRMVEEMLAARGIVVSHETVRQWALRFGQDFANRIQRRLPRAEHRRHKGLNNRAENSHQPTRRRERQMKRFKSAGQAQRFLSAHDQINNLFHLHRDHITASEYRAARTQAFQTWTEVIGVAAV